MTQPSQVRLIVEDAGERRGVRLGEGTLTVGSGPEAKLRLDAPNVAAIHADLEVQGGRAILRPRPGVMHPEIGGAPVAGPIELQHDQPVEIGGARLTARYSEGSSLRPPAEPPGPAPSAKARTAAGHGQATHPRRRRGTGGAWQSGGIAIGVVALAAGALYFLGSQRSAPTDAAFVPPEAHIGTARNLAASGQNDAALAELARLPPDLTPQLSAQVVALRAEIEQAVRERDRAVRNALGDAWKRENLELYEESHLHGKPEPGAIRLYLERLAYFAAEWPEHPDLEWVRRMQERYASLARLDQPLTFEDVVFRVRFYTVESDLPQWATALAAIEGFLRTAPPSERAAAEQLERETRSARQAWFEQKLAVAAAEDVRGNPGQAVAWLVRIVVHAGDPGMADQAAERLAARDDLAQYLRGYRSQQPEEYAVLAAQPRIADYLRRHPLE